MVWSCSQGSRVTGSPVLPKRNMRTIKRRWPKTAPRGDYVAMCDYCGVNWRRSQLIRDRAGYLVCPDDQGGRDAVTLAEETANAAQDNADTGYSPYEGGKYVGQ